MSSDHHAQRAGTQNEPATQPEQAALASQLALVQRHLAAGDFAAAESQCRQILKTTPGRLEASLMLGEALSSQGRHEDALAVLAALVKRRPDAGAAHYSLGNVLNRIRRYSEAAKHLHRATELQPHFAGGHCNLGIALEQLGDTAGAISAYERALSLDPNLWQARTNLGIVLLKIGKPDDAATHLRRAAALNPDAANTQFCLGRALQQLHQPAQALPCFERAVAIDPKLAGAWLGLGFVLGMLGRFAEAAAAYEKALAINPDLGAAHHALAMLRREVADAGELDRLRRILANPEGRAADRGAAGIAIAKILDAAGRYDEAFAAAQDGNRLARAAQLAADIRYDHDAFHAENDARMRLFTPERFAATRDWGNPTELPVFIVGYPRTGSTLVEQICASHSQVYGGGEMQDVPEIAAQIQRTAPEHWTPDLLRTLADRHAQRLAALAPGKLRVVDKMLDNVYHLGLIAIMFPRARVIVTHRDGRDAALSAFMQQFVKQLAYSTDLLDASRRWHETERMTAYWARCLPLAMHHVHYETLVRDFETEARTLISFLGLAWEPACLEFYKTERVVSTASLWQVRQPLYDSSIGRWRNYATHLGPLCAAVGVDPQAPTGTRPADIA